MVEYEHYRENLRHVVRPDETAERSDTPRVKLSDYEALMLQHVLTEYAGYMAGDNEERVAEAYIDYIDMTVRDEGRSFIWLYAHTDLAVSVLQDAVEKSFIVDPDLQSAVDRLADQQS